MPSTLPPPDRWPMRLVDQHGAVAHAWFPPGTPTDPAHVLPAAVYAELCHLAGVAPSSPWVAFRTQNDAQAAAVAAALDNERAAGPSWIMGGGRGQGSAGSAVRSGGALVSPGTTRRPAHPPAPAPPPGNPFAPPRRPSRLDLAADGPAASVCLEAWAERRGRGSSPGASPGRRAPAPDRPAVPPGPAARG